MSVIIRNRNEAHYLSHVLKALRAQDTACEIVVVDNQSSDDSAHLAISAGAGWVTIAAQDFTYGGSLNAGMRAVSHEAVVVLSAHSVPVGPSFLRTAVAPLDDPRVGAVRLVRADKPRELATWHERTGLEPGASVADVIARGPIASGCVFRRSAWQELPFSETIESDEDKVWAASAIEHGYCIATAPAVYAYLRPIGLIDGLRRDSRSNLGLYRATGHRRHIGLGSTIVEVVSGVGAATVAPVWRYVDAATVHARARRVMQPGTLWRDQRHRGNLKLAARSHLTAGRDTRRSA